jgi:hypothetical protein
MAPQGANLLNSTAISLPAFLLWPITVAFGPTLSYDVLATLAVCLSAWAAFCALRRIAHHQLSAWVGGLVYGFGGYMTGQATAHANLMVAIFPPIAAMLVDEVRQTRSPVRAGSLLGLCAAAQVFVNEEVLATTTIMVVLALIVCTLWFRPSRLMVARYVRAAGAALAVFAVVAGPALAYQMLGPQHVHGVVVTSGRYVNDLAGFVIPNSLDLLSSSGARHVTSGFSGFDGEFGAYLGVPLLALLLWAGWRLRRRALPASLLLLCAAIFSLGPHLRVLGHDTGILLPWVLPNHLPLLENVVPDRFNLFVWLAVAALLVALLDDLRLRPLFGRPAFGMAACGLALLPALPLPTPSELVAVPRVIGNASAFRNSLPNAATVLITPVANGQFAMYAQAQADFAYSVPVGGVFVPSPDGPAYGMRHGPLLYALAALGGQISTHAGRSASDSRCLKQLHDRERLNGDCRSYYLHALRELRVDSIIVTNLRARSAKRFGRFFVELLGPPREVDNTLIFASSGPLKPTPSL